VNGLALDYIYKITPLKIEQTTKNRTNHRNITTTGLNPFTKLSLSFDYLF
jgi:hypothetical protein